jgi:hypothetical protein
MDVVNQFGLMDHWFVGYYRFNKSLIQRIKKRPTDFIFFSVGRFCIRW